MLQPAEGLRAHRQQLVRELESRDGALEGDAVQRRVLEDEPAVAVHADLDEVRGRIVRERERVERVAQELERPPREAAEQAPLGAEDAVDRSRRRAHVVRDGADRQRVRAGARHDRLGRVEQGLGGLRVVEAGSSHLTRVSQRRYVTA
jgi:hypothetical protein